MAEVEISYKGSAIAQMNASGTKTLLTEGKYLEDDVTVEYTRPSAPSGTKNISITANGTTTEDVTNYASAQITANVPNTYAAADEGKVVSNGALVAQGSDTVTANDTYDTTLISSLTVNVSGGGGYTLDQIIKGTEPSGEIYYKADANLRAYAITSFNSMTKLTLDLSDGYGLSSSRHSIAQNAYMTALKIIFDKLSTPRVSQEYTITDNARLATVVWLGKVNFSQNAFRPNPALTTCDFEYASNIAQNVFYGCPLKYLILRRTDGITSLTSTNAFTNASQFRSAGTGGTLYVPNSLIASYQGSTNWASLLALNANNAIKSIESTHTDPTAPFDMTLYYADGTPIPTT